MHRQAESGGDRHPGEGDGWPWRCLDCGATIYHDGECCRECRSARRVRSGAREADRSGSFLAWMRAEPASTFALKVTLISGAEVGLTALWLVFLLGGATRLGVTVPV